MRTKLLPLCLMLSMMPLIAFSQIGTSDPKGTVIVNIRNTNNGDTPLLLGGDSISVDAGNNLEVKGKGNLKLYYVGTVNSIGDIPVVEYDGNGWVNKAALEPGDGYILYDSGKRDYGRIYVVRWLISASDSKSIIGAQIKYQFPWNEAAIYLNKIKEEEEKVKLEKDRLEKIHQEEKLKIYTENLNKVIKKEYVIINGIKWDTRNLEVEDKQHFGFEEAKNLAKSSGKRLPTYEEITKLTYMGATWDDNLKGSWLGLDHQLKNDSKNSIFLPASGVYYDNRDVLIGLGEDSGYWSITSDNLHIYMYTAKRSSALWEGYRLRSSRFSVRCVQDY